jgi:hypothetical protein
MLSFIFGKAITRKDIGHGYQTLTAGHFQLKGYNKDQKVLLKQDPASFEAEYTTLGKLSPTAELVGFGLHKATPTFLQKSFAFNTNEDNDYEAQEHTSGGSQKEVPHPKWDELIY